MNSTGGAASDAASDPATELARFIERKRRVYTVASSAAVVVTVISWLVREPDDVMLAVLYPVLAAALVLFAVAIQRRWLSMQLLEWLVLGVLCAVVLGRLAWHLLFAGPIDDRLLVLTGAHYWSIGAVIVGGFVLLDRRRGLRLGIGLLLASVVLVATGAGPELVGPGGSTEALVYLVRVHAFLVLLLVLASAIATLREQLSRALARSEALEELATTDPLTGLANRRAATEVLEHQAQAAERYDRPLSVITIDIDRFKSINDTHGHPAGDQVLRAIAEVLRSQARDADLVARWGGEEFVIIAPDTTGADATVLAERCRSAVAEARAGGFEVTATFGVAQLRAGEPVDALLVRADRLLYEAKHHDRCRSAGGVSHRSLPAASRRRLRPSRGR